MVSAPITLWVIGALLPCFLAPGTEYCPCLAHSTPPSPLLGSVTDLWLDFFGVGALNCAFNRNEPQGFHFPRVGALKLRGLPAKALWVAYAPWFSRSKSLSLNLTRQLQLHNTNSSLRSKAQDTFIGTSTSRHISLLYHYVLLVSPKNKHKECLTSKKCMDTSALDALPGQWPPVQNGTHESWWKKRVHRRTLFLWTLQLFRPLDTMDLALFFHWFGLGKGGNTVVSPSGAATCSL